jgi:hypothetical protein
MFIKSEHPYEVEIAGVLLPKRIYSLSEISYGKRSFVEVTDKQLELLKKDGVFQSLLNSNQYSVVEKIPLELLSPTDKVRQLEQKNKEVLTEKDIEINNLKEEIKKLKGKDK